MSMFPRRLRHLLFVFKRHWTQVSLLTPIFGGKVVRFMVRIVTLPPAPKKIRSLLSAKKVNHPTGGNPLTHLTSEESK